MDAIEELLEAGGIFLEFWLFTGNFIEVRGDIFLTFFVIVFPASFILIQGINLFFDKFVNDCDDNEDAGNEPHKYDSSLYVLGLGVGHQFKKYINLGSYPDHIKF